MAEELPGHAPDDPLPAASVEPQTSDPIVTPRTVDEQGRRPRRISPTWIILSVLLLLAAAALASDIFRGRIPQNAAFKQINGELDREQSALGEGQGDSQSSLVSAQKIHELLGRQPDLVETRHADVNGETVPILVETYKFPGIIKSYNVVATYLEDDTNNAKPETALKWVRKQ